MEARSDSVVIIPMYNEKENAAAIIDAVIGLPRRFDVLVVDDNSPDGTAGIVRDKMAQYPGRVDLLERTGKLGLGTAYIAGFRRALDNGYGYIFEMDADFSHNPQDLLKLYDACATGGMDVAVGSRYLTGVNVVNWPMGRVLMSYFASKYVRAVTGLDVADTTAGFCCYRREVLEIMELDKIRFKGYAFQIEMKFTASKCGFKVGEVPIVFVNRVLGTSKMSSGIFSEAFFGVMKLKISSWTRNTHILPRADRPGPQATTHIPFPPPIVTFPSDETDIILKRPDIQRWIPLHRHDCGVGRDDTPRRQRAHRPAGCRHRGLRHRRLRGEDGHARGDRRACPFP